MLERRISTYLPAYLLTYLPRQVLPTPSDIAGGWGSGWLQTKDNIFLPLYVLDTF